MQFQTRTPLALPVIVLNPLSILCSDFVAATQGKESQSTRKPFVVTFIVM